VSGTSTESVRTPVPGGTTGPPAAPARAGRLLAALLGATFLGTVSNNVVNVPLRQITTDFDASVTSGVLVASGSVLVLAVAMPLTGWVSDRLGRRRTLLIALTVLAVGTVGAALAPTLPLLVASRALQGLGCAAVPTAVMGTLARCWPAERRSRVMGAWGAANGIGQAVGPPIGGLVADAWGWRAIFAGLLPVTLGVLVLAWRAVPRDAGTPVRVEWLGAGSLTLGVAALMTAATAAPQDGVPAVWPIAGVVVGIVALTTFVVAGLRRREPFIDPRLLVEMRWLRSAAGVFVQQATLAAVLVSVPLYLTGTVGLSGTRTGLLVFLLPVVWAASAPLVGLLADRVGPRWVLRSGLGLLLAVDVGLAVVLGRDGDGVLPIAGLLLAAGAGVALVQTPSLTGATRSPAGQRGVGLGLFNMMRFVGSATGTAGVAAAYPEHLPWLFAGCAGLAVLGLVLAFSGRETPTERPPAHPSADLTAG
jgi:EmrB/QacA subfamily drug resistance transporter